jgi:hypothetical protein
MCFVLSVASIWSESGCIWRPLDTGGPPEHAASVICAAIAADAASARKKGDETVNWCRTPALTPNMLKARSGVG